MSSDIPLASNTTVPLGKTAGALLREARQAQGLEIEAVAALLKVPVRKLEALEEDRHTDFQGPTFVRALAQAMCRAVKLDSAPVLALLPHTQGNSLDQVTGGLNSKFQDPAYGRDWRGLLREQRGVMLVMLVFALAAAALWWLPEGWLDRARSSLNSPATAASAVAEEVALQAAPAPLAEPIASDRLPPASAAPLGWPAPLPVQASQAAPASVAQGASAVPAQRVASAPARAASWPVRSASGVARAASAGVSSAARPAASAVRAAAAVTGHASVAATVPAAASAQGGQ